MTDHIDPDDYVPRYYQLSNILRERILNGKLEAHHPIPSERELEKIYRVSRTTIRPAIDILVRQGFLYREHGKGTFVSPPKLQKGISELTSFTEDMKRRGLAPGQKILMLGYVEPPENVRAQLELPLDRKEVLCVDRLRLGDDSPMGLQTSYYNLPDGLTFSREELEAIGSIYALLREKLHLIPTEADETLEVTVASAHEASLLRVKAGSPLLLSQRTTYSQTRRVIEFAKILYRGDRYRYFAKLTR
ncbi:MAG TPA: GntR family transcriptional regulator [Anaerolineales bacterium]|nr:GntR family transcriptional regulator [Anaerolineales bacterium]